MITTDSREPLQIQGLFDKVERLEYGDFRIETSDTSFLIERKKIGDLWNSLKSGRLNEQLSGCDALLIHHDEIEYLRDYNIEQIRLLDVINGITKHHMVWHVIGTKHLCDTLRRYERQMIEGTFGEFRKVVVKEDLPVAVRILAQFEGIGVERSKSLLRIYKSLNRVFRAADEQDTISGIGPGLMSKISERLAKEEDIK
jgi:ERCC4-type nuclease